MKKKKKLRLTTGYNKLYRKQKTCHICKKEFNTDNNYKKYYKVIDHCHDTEKYREAAHVCNLRYKTPKEIPVVFHNGSKDDYHFIIKELAEEFECIGDKTQKYITFSVPINKEFENGKTITYKIKFIDSFRFMSSSLSSLADNLSEGLHNNKCTDCKSCLEYISTKDELLIFNCLKCSKNHKNYFNKYLTKKFANTYKFCDGDINKFCLMLKKVFIHTNT